MVKKNDIVSYERIKYFNSKKSFESSGNVMAALASSTKQEDQCNISLRVSAS